MKKTSLALALLASICSTVAMANQSDENAPSDGYGQAVKSGVPGFDKFFNHAGKECKSGSWVRELGGCGTDSEADAKYKEYQERRATGAAEYLNALEKNGGTPITGADGIFTKDRDGKAMSAHEHIVRDTYADLIDNSRPGNKVLREKLGNDFEKVKQEAISEANKPGNEWIKDAHYNGHRSTEEGRRQNDVNKEYSDTIGRSINNKARSEQNKTNIEALDTKVNTSIAAGAAAIAKNANDINDVKNAVGGVKQDLKDTETQIRKDITKAAGEYDEQIRSEFDAWEEKAKEYVDSKVENGQAGRDANKENIDRVETDSKNRDAAQDSKIKHNANEISRVEKESKARDAAQDEKIKANTDRSKENETRSKQNESDIAKNAGRIDKELENQDKVNKQAKADREENRNKITDTNKRIDDEIAIGDEFARQASDVVVSNADKISENSQQISRNSVRIDNLEDALVRQGEEMRERYDGVKASTHAAMSARAFTSEPGEFAVGAGIGAAGSKRALAIGGAYQFNENWSGNFIGSYETAGKYTKSDLAVGVGAQYTFK
ncbi:YadA C-terminal domain-containing protein [Vibrio maritimus]|uniref:YadA C-terminal domain-containing protein n=1 Tax=Vibrio maritimus TaxID=990268 RepID=UPI001F1A5791|nr:YadA C-terminal domain-containing protein [Vibrio maritimus]